MRKFILYLILLIFVAVGVIYLLGITYNKDITIEGPYKGQHVVINGVSIRYLQKGIGQDVLLIHGSMGSLEDWDALMPILAENYRVTAFDRPGHGLSGGHLSGGGIVTNALFTRKLIEKLKLKNVLVVGHSYGGAVALKLGVEHTPNIRGYALLAPKAYKDEEIEILEPMLANPYFGLGLIRALRPFVTEDMIRQRLTEAVKPDGDAMPPGFIEQRVKLWNRTGSLYARAKQTAKEDKELQDMSNRYNVINKPVYILVGKNDTFVNIVSDANILSESIPRGRRIRLENTGHYIQFKNPQRVAKAINDLAEETVTLSDTLQGGE